jgi:hypothetical protein
LVFDGAVLRLSEVVVEGYRSNGVVATRGATVAIDAGVFRRGGFVSDVFAQSSSLTVSRLWIEPHLRGVETITSWFSGRDLVIRAPGPTGSDGVRIATGSADGARIWILGMQNGLAVGTNANPLEAQLRDVLISGTPSSAVRHGGGDVRLDRLRVEDCGGFGVYSSGDTPSGQLGLVISNLRIARCTAGGIRLLGDRSITIDHVALTDNMNSGITVGDAIRDATVVASEVSIDGFKAGVCVNDPCPQGGVVSYLHGNFHASRFAIQHGVGVPAMDVSGGGAATLSDGLVADNMVAIRVGPSSFDLSSVLLRVLYRNDGTLVDRGP